MSDRWCECGICPTLCDVAELLGETYKPDGAAIVLASRVERIDPDRTLIEVCQTVEGRRRVAEWAESLTGMVAT